jgi:hypothetical protein
LSNEVLPEATPISTHPLIAGSEHPARKRTDPELGSERLEEAFADLRDRPIGEAVDALMDL